MKISPFWKKTIVSLSILALIGSYASNKLFHGSSLLNSNEQQKVDDLSALQRVKSMYDTPQVKKDLISDENTQKIIASYDPPPEKSADENSTIPKKSCDSYDEALGKCQTSPAYQKKLESIAQNISLNTKSSLSDETVPDEPEAEYETADLKSFSQEKVKIPEPQDGLSLLIASVGKTEVLAGRSTGIGGAENQIKAGTTVLAVINEAKTITSSGEQYASASIIGAPFDRAKFPDGITALIKMKLNGTQDGIEGQIISCSSRRNSDKTISCSGQLEDINGENALRGQVYSNTGWQIVTTAATTFLAGLSLAKLTTSATQFGNTVDQTTSNALYQALSSAITNMGQQIAASFARSGTQISIPGRVVVRILFTQDAVW